MSPRVVRALPALILLASCSSAALAAPKARVPARPTKAPPRVVLGTKQLSGDQAVPGLEYTIGTNSPINFQLDSAAYTTARVRIDERDYMPGADEKYLLLRFTLHNPQPRVKFVRFDTLRFTVVDNTNVNREGRSNVGLEETKGLFQMQLKPGQKVSAYTFIALPAAASAPKLIVTGEGAKVLRYDLTGKVKPLAGPVASPADAAGVVALGDVPAKFGDVYEMGDFDVAVESAAISEASIGRQRLKAGERNMVFTLRVKNAAAQQRLIRFDTIRLQVQDVDGLNVPYRQNLLARSRDEDVQTRMDPGQELTLRSFVTLAPDQKAKSLTAFVGTGARRFVYDLGAVQ